MTSEMNSSSSSAAAASATPSSSSSTGKCYHALKCIVHKHQVYSSSSSSKVHPSSLLMRSLMTRTQVATAIARSRQCLPKELDILAKTAPVCHTQEDVEYHLLQLQSQPVNIVIDLAELRVYDRHKWFFK